MKLIHLVPGTVLLALIASLGCGDTSAQPVRKIDSIAAPTSEAEDEEAGTLPAEETEAPTAPTEGAETPTAPTKEAEVPSAPNGETAEEFNEFPAESPRSKGFRNTYYYMILESEYPEEPRTEEILDPEGKVLARVSKRFRKDLLMEGSGKMLDGRVLNFAGKVGDIYRFHATVHAWGRGAGNCALKPFKSIAVDPTQIPLGSTVFITETKGMKLPDGTVHNGFWYAHDTGGAILHDRVDIFVGLKKQAGVLEAHGITHLEALKIKVTKRPTSASCVHQDAT